MSKERLEEFREFIDFMYESIDIEDHQRFIAISESMIKDGWFKWIYKFAKEQAERVQELEEENKRIRQMKYHEAYEQGKFDTNIKVWYEIPKLEQQNKRYREAIRKALYDLTEIINPCEHAADAEKTLFKVFMEIDR